MFEWVVNFVPITSFVVWNCFFAEEKLGIWGTGLVLQVMEKSAKKLLMT